MGIVQKSKWLAQKIAKKIKKTFFWLKSYVSSRPPEVQKFDSYDAYVSKQLEKTTSPQKRAGWTDPAYYEKKVQSFKDIFSKNASLIKGSKKALSVGSRVGNEILALKSYGVECIGIDLVPYKDLVVKGDMHNLAFDDGEFDLVFSNILDHSLYPDKFFSEVNRVLKEGGHFILHVCVGVDLDEHSAINVVNIKQIKNLAKGFEIVRVRDFDRQDLSNFSPINTEFLFKKTVSATASAAVATGASGGSSEAKEN